MIDRDNTSWTLVTGGAKGLGAALSRGLAASGHNILVHYRNSRVEAEQVVIDCKAQGVNAVLVQGDFSSIEATEAFTKECLKRYPIITSLINNVGNYLIKSCTKTTPLEWNSLFQTNLHAPFSLCTAFLPTIEQAKGSVINIGVTSANTIHADTTRTAYMATKMGLLMLTKSLARELAHTGVCVNMVSPSYLENAVDLPTKCEKLPMGRAVAFDEVVSTVRFLIDESNRSITGQNIEVGGAIGLIH